MIKKTFIIAEIGINHNGSEKKAKNLIKIAYSAGADAVKFQTYITCNIVVKITKLAQGLPVGGEIENLDDGTLFSAFKNRSKINSSSD